MGSQENDVLFGMGSQEQTYVLFGMGSQEQRNLWGKSGTNSTLGWGVRNNLLWDGESGTKTYLDGVETILFGMGSQEQTYVLFGMGSQEQTYVLFGMGSQEQNAITLTTTSVTVKPYCVDDLCDAVPSEPPQSIRTCEKTCAHDCALIHSVYRCTYKHSASRHSVLLPAVLVAGVALLVLVLAAGAFTLRRRRKLPRGAPHQTASFENNVYSVGPPAGTGHNRAQRVEIVELSARSDLPPPYPGFAARASTDQRLSPRPTLHPRTSDRPPVRTTVCGVNETLPMATSCGGALAGGGKRFVSTRKSSMCTASVVSENVYEDLDMVKKVRMNLVNKIRHR
ncbi:hypothetical protein NP493_656g00043 [Ridgeia piscesae]|uniref:Uncharacterized protein n=1 Tax=Ridgeia piscesae TaxID=27915 RepID=A0AAD9KTD7_RIDPI|nr:hypothetical protein NP493_656g00043 [Ridgeia piscesae]